MSMTVFLVIFGVAAFVVLLWKALHNNERRRGSITGGSSKPPRKEK